MNNTNNTQDQSPLIFYPKKEWLLASAWPLLCGIFLAFTVFLYQQSKTTRLKALSAIGSVLILLWEITFFPFLSRLLFPKPLLIVNDEGIIYQPPSVWFVNLAWNIKWKEISAMYITELSVQKKTTLTLLIAFYQLIL